MGFITLETANLPISINTTTRSDGFSAIPYDNFNMSYDVGDDPNAVLKNREKLCKDLEVLPYNLIIPKQHHSDKVLKITNITDDREADAIYTSNKDLALSILHSDCAPIFLYCEDKEIIVAIHASIKGTLNLICKKTVKTLVQKEKVNPEHIFVFYGPGVTFSHIPADETLIKKVENLNYTMCLKRTMNQEYVDINLLNYMQLVDSGVLAKHITLSKYDTYDNANLFFSSMRNNITGRMLSVIKFKK